MTEEQAGRITARTIVALVDHWHVGSNSVRADRRYKMEEAIKEVVSERDSLLKQVKELREAARVREIEKGETK